MGDQLDVNEMILRAVYLASKRLGMWHGKRITSAAFKDKRGLSVDRLYDRQVDEGVRYMHTKLRDHIVSVTVNDCNSVSAHLVYCHSPNNIFIQRSMAARTQFS